MIQETKKISNGVKIILERKKCIGCGSCQALCPGHFELIEDGKTHLIRSKKDSKTDNEELEVEKPDCIKEAADVCPVQCIKIMHPASGNPGNFTP